MLFGDGIVFKIIGAVFHLALVYFGIKIYKEAETDALKVIALIMAAIGAISLLSLIHIFLAILVAAFCIYMGWKMLKRR